MKESLEHLSTGAYVSVYGEHNGITFLLAVLQIAVTGGLGTEMHMRQIMASDSVCNLLSMY